MSDAGVHGVAAVVDAWLRMPRLLRAVAPITGMIVLWWSSSREPEPQPYSAMRALLHNAMHPVVYALLGASIWLTIANRPAVLAQPWRSRGAVLLATCYGVIDELHQSFVPGRVCSFADALADLSGAALAVVLLGAAVGVSAQWLRPAVICGIACVASVVLATVLPL